MENLWRDAGDPDDQGDRENWIASGDHMETALTDDQGDRNLSHVALVVGLSNFFWPPCCLTFLCNRDD